MGIFEFKEIFGHDFSLDLFYNENLYYLLNKSSLWERSTRDIGQNAISHSDFWIFKSTISTEQIDEIASSFAC